MSATKSPVLRECIDLFARQLAEALHRQQNNLRQAIEVRLVAERTPERRQALTLLDERIGGRWADFCRVVFECIVDKASVYAGLKEEDDSDVASSVSSLRLVDDDQMEWDLSLGGLGSRLRGAGGKSLTQLEGRMAALLKKQLDDDDFVNPLGPETCVFALKKAILEIAPENAARKMMLLLLEGPFSESVLRELHATNEALNSQGIDGVTRPKIVSSGGSRGGGAASPGAGGGSPGGSGNTGGDAGGDMMAMLQALVQQQSPGAGFPPGMALPAGSAMGFGGMPPGMVAVPAGLLESLNRLQSLDFNALQVQSSDPLVGQTNVLRELRQQDVAKSLPPIEAVTIDIVATLFDFIFDDDLVPDSVKALVGRMQIPLLKVAMLDKSFFSNKEHPARALLNEISRASIAAGKSLVQGDPEFERIRAAVNRVLDEFEQDQEIFATLLVDVKALVADQEARATQLAEQSKKVAEQQEQQELAEIKAGESFSQLIENGLSNDIPSHISDFLSRHYPAVLKRALLAGGTQGQAWAIATQTLSDLLWTLLPKATPEDRQRMIGMLADLLRRVNAFLDKVGVSVDDKSRFIDALAQHHSSVIKGVRKPTERKTARKVESVADVVSDASSAPLEIKPSPLDLPSSEVVTSTTMAPTVVVTRVVQEDGIEVESMTVSGKATGARTIRSAEVSSLERGDWVEFVDDDGLVTRARLSWVSPYRGVMLFANPQSSKAISINQEALAIQIKAGKARVLADDPMMDRALDKTMASMKAA